MATQILVNDDLVGLLHSFDQPLDQAARELMVLELYRRGAISSGKAADLLGLDRFEFISHASELGISFFEMTEGEWAAERAASDQL